MAFIILKDHKPVTMPHDKAVKLLNVIEGREQGNTKQQRFARRVKKIYFGRQYEPDGVLANAWWVK